MAGSINAKATHKETPMKGTTRAGNGGRLGEELMASKECIKE